MQDIFLSKRNNYSANVGLYDFVPKYYHGDLEKIRKNGKYLDILSKEFVYKKQDMVLSVSPALIKQKNGNTKAFYPSQREEIVEDVLRKFATDPSKSCFLDDRLSVRFTIYDLRKELIRINHEYSYSQIRESLQILSKVNIEIKTENGKSTFSSNMFETFGIVDGNGYVEQFSESDEYNRKVVYFVRFNSLVSNSVKDGTWKILNYTQCMSYKKVISRWLHKRISYIFLLNTDERKKRIPYNIMLSTIIRDSGMTEYSSIRLNLAQVQKCLEEMLRVGSINGYEVEKIYDEHKKNKIKDAKFLLYMSDSFLYDADLNYVIKNNNCAIDKKYSNYNNIDHIETIKSLELIDNNTEIRRLIKELLEEYKLSTNDIDKIIKHISKINSINNKIIKTEEDIIDNIKSAINYINKEISRGNNYNIVPIIISSLNENWKDHSISTMNLNIDYNRKELTDKERIQDLLSKALTKNHEKIIEKLIEQFGINNYVNWLSSLDFRNIKDIDKNNTLILYHDNQFVIDTIKRDYLNGIQKISTNNEKIWFRKGLKQIVQDVLPNIINVEIVYENKK